MKQSVKPNPNNPETKKKQVTQMFNGISRSYDTLNRIITLGVDVLWRKRVVREIQKHKHDVLLDIATGTGDLVIALSKLKTKKIIGLDISPGMLEIGKQKVKAEGLDQRIDMQLGDSEALAYDDNTFDGVTIAFGVRNFEHLDLGLQEICRVLKPQGTLVILETAVPQNPILKSLYSFYTQKVMPFIGKMFSKNRTAYQYLSDSAAAFPCGKAFHNILKKNGFISIEDFPQTLGVASIYVGKKP
ncbi:bifunctional demethylmenaquinone methyltransferase/2-methoxy-6-polyprenyl-1,4-benzoquinol methylase UbiE [Flavobacteriaceae bacterium]|jgi:demethylmenaquinone methyltransferase/2-methoxy-6-polyprenyl-1,4-benzoquinol methylase|nr:bifunctional demethylmenaquinone methyltransferase/2-methoxy-6-polyprenyl-1,4-benzoquinol methylase UbiE [Flavobacteriaceae bacterium]MDA9037269.1 bifunctional demethylmenaquinone methyltransferase/2-methoxy-6-polyprenyl-1,4-benzoquinol methylase UbiE [Flavobacteriaceae bacterium]MDC0386379.1 bifunctional demethylmenaquinone methyltransferase/2-methoxy-6-polyprenyl-1,4-benzoquinol methylase UbiE [Flavobacteriaceae bacterium]MDC0871853.1 bifunctional demethylmenaquinone methyltransferase/2-met